MKKFHKVFKKPQKCKQKDCEIMIKETFNDQEFCEPCYLMLKTVTRAALGINSPHSAWNDFQGYPKSKPSFSSDPWYYASDI